MQIKQYTAYSTQHTEHSTQHTVHSTHYTAHRTQHTVHSSQYTVHSTQYTVYSIQYTIHSTQYSVYSVQYTLYSTQYTSVRHFPIGNIPGTTSKVTISQVATSQMCNFPKFRLGLLRRRRLQSGRALRLGWAIGTSGAAITG